MSAVPEVLLGWDRRGLLRLREVVTLAQLAAHLDQPIDLGLALQPFGDRRDFERTGQRHDMANNRVVVLPLAGCVHIGSVEFEEFEVERSEMTQRGVSGPEVIERESDANFPSGVERGPRRAGIGNKRGLRKFEIYLRRVDARSSQRCLEIVGEV
ncbi:MAG: hypothetical protein ACI9C1_000193 [Candidatus Aldehydirespiratoraceae bacterium]|jgi:hypothetical protein